MSNDQNTILDEMRTEAIAETPLGELFIIVGDMLGRTPTAAELNILTEYLKGFNSYMAEEYKKALLEIPLDKAD